tara:strand:- start:13369 stop:13896 length:528 start_codon:yes stop_codon:yes gene_type:complete
MTISLIFFVVIAGLCANLNDDDEKVSLCYLYAILIMGTGLFVKGLEALVIERDLFHSKDDPVTLFFIFYQYLVPAILNLFAISRFAYASNTYYRLVSIPLALTVICNISIPVENLLNGTTYIWNLDYVIPSLCVVEVVLLFIGSDFVRNRNRESDGADDLHRNTTLYSKAFNRKH